MATVPDEKATTMIASSGIAARQRRLSMEIEVALLY